MSRESEATETHEGGIDPAALAAASLAAAISVIAPPGPYGPASIAIGTAILLLILAYDVAPRRNWRQSLAYSSVVALIATLILGYPLECLFDPNHAERLRVLLREMPEDRSYSQVPPWVVLIVWVIVAVFVWIWDRRRARQGTSIRKLPNGGEVT